MSRTFGTGQWCCIERAEIANVKLAATIAPGDVGQASAVGRQRERHHRR